MSADLLKTPLHALHIELGAKMVPFGGYDMPVQYATGILTEHKHTRAAADVQDVARRQPHHVEPFEHARLRLGEQEVGTTVRARTPRELASHGRRV